MLILNVLRDKRTSLTNIPDENKRFIEKYLNLPNGELETWTKSDAKKQLYTLLDSFNTTPDVEQALQLMYKYWSETREADVVPDEKTSKDIDEAIERIKKERLTQEEKDRFKGFDPEEEKMLREYLKKKKVKINTR